jgi:phosphoribosylformylglycinamidine synthase
MSGTFQNINVPPTLIAFGITMVDASKVVSTDFKAAGENIYLLRHTPMANYMPNTDMLKANFDAFHALVEEGKVSAAYTIGMGGVAEAVTKMAFGSNIGANINLSENDLFNYNYGSILFASSEELNIQNLEKLGTTTAEATLVVNGESFDLNHLYKVNTEKFAEIYPATAPAEDMEDLNGQQSTVNSQQTYPGEAVEHPIVYIPVFPGTNCDYDMAKAFRTAGAEVRTSVFCNLTADDIARSIEVMAREIRGCHILALAGGFSSGDEPDGSAKFIATVLNNSDVAREIHALIDRKGLIIGICNGFQALVKSGLLPYGRLGMVTPDSPTLFRNNINRHISQMVTTRISTVKSPWLAGFNVGDEHTIAMSHGEGKFVVSEELARELFAKGQVAFQYVDANSNITMQSPENPNGSSYAIEGIISEDGLIIGKMGHTERYEENIFKNIAGNKRQPLFDNAVRYFNKIHNA